MQFFPAQKNTQMQKRQQQQQAHNNNNKYQDSLQTKYQQATALYDQGHYEACLDTMQSEPWPQQEKSELHCNLLLLMGNCYYSLGKEQQAMQTYSACLGALETKYGKYYPGLVSVHVNIALIQMQQQQHKSAMQTLALAQKLAENIMGADRLALADIYHNRGVIYDLWGQIDDALNMYNKALKVREIILGKQHTSLALTLENMAQLLKDSHKYKDAIAAQQRAVEIRNCAGKRNTQQMHDLAHANHQMGNATYITIVTFSKGHYCWSRQTRRVVLLQRVTRNTHCHTFPRLINCGNKSMAQQMN